MSLTAFIKSSFLNRIFNRCPSMHSGFARPDNQETKQCISSYEPRVNQITYNEKEPGLRTKPITAMQYLDGDHQTGQGQPCGTPQSPSPQVLISCRS